MVICLALSIILYTLLAGWRPSNVFPPLASLPLIVSLFVFVFRIHLPIRLTHQWISWYVSLIAMFVWCLLIDLINGCLQTNLNRYEVFLFATIFALVCATIVRSEDEMRILLFAIVCSVALSSIVAVLQISPYREPFLALWRWRYMSETSESAMLRFQELYMSLLSGRACGMTPYSLTLAHQIVVSSVISVCLLATERLRSCRALVVSCLVALILGSFATGSRIAILVSLSFSIATVLRIWSLTYVSAQRHYLWTLSSSIAFVFVVLVLVISSNSLSFYKFRGLTEGDILRLQTWKSIIFLLSEQPHILLVGLGGGGFEQWGKNVGVFGSAHNQFLGAFVEYGFIGLLLLFLFYWQTFRTIKILKRNQTFQELRQKFLIYEYCYINSLLSYIVSSLFHDQGPLTGDLFHLMMLSVFVTLSKVYTKVIISK